MAVEPVHHVVTAVGGKTPALRRVIDKAVGLGERVLAQVGEMVDPSGPSTGADGEKP